ncbi:MAG: M20/M25/M40 family metallo-hydrolase, partial [Gemmobacter sp.]
VEDWVARFEAEAVALSDRMAAVHPGAGVTITRAFAVPALVPEPEGAAEALARRLTGDNGTHVVSYGTEAGQFQAVGHSTVVCGPGDIAQAHQPDEFLSVAEFEAGWRFMEGVVADLCTRGALA